MSVLWVKKKSKKLRIDVDDDCFWVLGYVVVVVWSASNLIRKFRLIIGYNEDGLRWYFFKGWFWRDFRWNQCKSQNLDLDSVLWGLVRGSEDSILLFEDLGRLLILLVMISSMTLSTVHFFKIEAKLLILATFLLTRLLFRSRWASIKINIRGLFAKIFFDHTF